MDADRFDALARSLGSRRGLLKTLTGGVVAAALAALGVQEASAACKFKGPCKRDRQCCSGACDVNGRCLPCPAGTKVCKRLRRCVSTTAPGACCLNRDCPGDGRCVDGTCANCAPTGANCANDGDCCAGTCGNQRANGTGICRRQGCAATNQGCTSNGDCCAGTCSGNTCRRETCRQRDQNCQDAGDCCEGRCVPRVAGDPNTGECRP